jgi:hypothetical protein
MKRFTNFLAAATLLAAISTSVYAGDIGTPGCPTPSTDPGDIGTPGAPITATSDDDSLLWTEALLTIISIFP